MDEDHNDLYDINELEEYLNESEKAESQPSKSDKSYKTQKRKPSRAPSWVWEHFEKIPDSDPSNPRCKCKYCGVDYACDTKRCGTSTLRNHLMNQCKKYPNRTVEKSQQVLSFDSSSSNLVSTSTTFSKEAWRLACGQMIIIDELPFSHVEGEGFRKFCNTLNPKYEPPSRRTISRDVFQLYVRSSPSRLSKFKECVEKEKMEFRETVVLDLEYVSYLFEDAYESGMVESLTKDVKDTLYNLYDFYKEVDSMDESSKVSNPNDNQSIQAQQSGMMVDSMDDGISTVASESAFSTRGRILDAFRSSLGPKMVEALICSQNWLKSNPMRYDYRVKVPIEDVAYYDSIESGTIFF
nr:uncharacterized protein LOC125420342 [Ziziphus jujuba var. spinosa]